MADRLIVRLAVLPNYRNEVSFADGTSGVTDLSPRLSQARLEDGRLQGACA
jgi:hypothetical protein